MLFRAAAAQPGQTVLVQGAGGGVATAAIALGARRGRARVGDEPRRGQARPARWSSARTQAFETGARLPERVDAVLETVGEATWSTRCGAEAGRRGRRRGRDLAATRRRPSSRGMFFLQLRVLGSTMGTRDELAQLVRLLRRERPAPA